MFETDELLWLCTLDGTSLTSVSIVIYSQRSIGLEQTYRKKQLNNVQTNFKNKNIWPQKFKIKCILGTVENWDNNNNNIKSIVIWVLFNVLSVLSYVKHSINIEI